MISEVKIRSFIEMGISFNRESSKVVCGLGNIGVSFYFCISEYVDNLLTNSFFPTENDSSWRVYIWSNSSQQRLVDILSEEELFQIQSHTFEPTSRYRMVADPSGGAIYCLDFQSKQGAIWISGKTIKNADFFITPFRAVLSWILGTVGGEILHGACMKIEGKVVALSGQSGNGKSVLLHKALSEGCQVMGDDAFAATPKGLIPIYSRTKLNFDIDPKEFGLDADEFMPFSKKQVHTLKKTSVFEADHLDYFFFLESGRRNAFRRISTGESVKRLLSDNCTETIGTSVNSLGRLAQLSKNTIPVVWSRSKDIEVDFTALRDFINEAN